jgi:hypothetical protein
MAGYSFLLPDSFPQLCGLDRLDFAPLPFFADDAVAICRAHWVRADDFESLVEKIKRRSPGGACRAPGTAGAIVCP